MLEVQLKKQQGRFFINAGFSTDRAGVTALFGTSGAGKTSVVNIVAGLSRPDSGKIVIGNRCCFDSEKKIDLPPEKRRIGYVFQEARLFPHLSVRANLTYGMHLQKKEDLYVDFDRVVDLLGINGLLDRRPARLSGGEKQRVAIGRALLCSPLLLLMDEPLASLDRERKNEVLPFIRDLSLNFKVPILYVSHQMDEIVTLADHMVVLEKGTVASAGPVAKYDMAVGPRALQPLKIRAAHGG
ncbi:MAG: molybdenum ABC transporter ATP-binding protein [Desulfobacter sp.]|nr:MAG: molybdenum ABC transporter ATP-binding protein [Desulfobacter sp.]